MKICCSFLALVEFPFCIFSIFRFLYFSNAFLFRVFWKTHSLDKRVEYFLFYLFFFLCSFGECIAKHIHENWRVFFPAIPRSLFAGQKLLVVVNVFEQVHSVFR